MKKKRILIASIIFILIICIVTAVFIIKNRNRSTSNTMYTYGSGDVRCNYSEDNVLYLDDSRNTASHRYGIRQGHGLLR